MSSTKSQPDEEHRTSTVETVGFALHVLLVTAPPVYVLLRVGLLPSIKVDDDLWNLLPDTSVIGLILHMLVGLVVSVPFIYFGLNSQSVPRMDSTDTLFDDYTRKLEIENVDVAAIE